MPLQEFTAARTKSRAKEPRLGVQKNGRVSLNSVALEMLGNPESLVLLFDPETYEFGIRAGRSGEAHAYPIRREVNASATAGGNVSSLALWNYYEVDYSKLLGSYVARQEGKVLVISLRKKGAVEPDDDGE